MAGESIGRIVKAIFPFFLIMVGLALLITFGPSVVTYLPSIVEFKG